MLVISEPNSGPPSRTASILDSPTLARVERARLRLEASSTNGSLEHHHHQYDDSLERSNLDSRQSLLAGRIPIASMTGPIKRGLLWQQRDRLFSRWKERYFVLTRDYLHCFKRASGSSDRISDMGQFIFKVKLVDVEKVEWLNRRSYSAIGLLLGREGRVLLRCDHCLEDWYELLEECTLVSKERRQALKITQGPRSRASLAAPPSHASFQAHHFGLGGTYSSALDDWLMTRQKSPKPTNPFLFSDSVPDLSVLNNENHISSGLSTNHSIRKKVPYSSVSNSNTRYSSSLNGFVNPPNHNITNNISVFSNGFYGSPGRILMNSFGSNNVVDEEDESEVQLRRPRNNFRQENGNGGHFISGGATVHDEKDWMYRKPRGPNDIRQSATTDIDYSACDSSLGTASATHRPSSYRDVSYSSKRDSGETTVSSSCGTILLSPGGSLRAKHLNSTAVQATTKNATMLMMNANNTSSTLINNASNMNGGIVCGTRYSIQDKILRIRNAAEEESITSRCASIKSANRLNHNELYDPNQNRYYKMNGNLIVSPNRNSSHHNQQQQQEQHLNGNNGSAVLRERYQHPALIAIINEAEGMKFRDRSYSDCQQCPRRSVNNNPSPNPRRAAFFGTPTRV